MSHFITYSILLPFNVYGIYIVPAFLKFLLLFSRVLHLSVLRIFSKFLPRLFQEPAFDFDIPIVSLVLISALCLLLFSLDLFHGFFSEVLLWTLCS